MIYVYVTNTTIFFVVCLLLLRHNYMFRPSMLAIFRLYMRNLSIIYTKVCGKSTVCEDIHTHLACSCYLTTQRGRHTSKKSMLYTYLYVSLNCLFVCSFVLFVFVALQPTVVVFPQPGSGP